MLDGGLHKVTRNGQPKTETARRALVVGLGHSGLSAVRWLSAHGHEVAVTDSRAHPPGLPALESELPGTALFLDGFSEDALARADLVVLSPGVPRADPYVQSALARGLPVIGDIELFARTVRAPVAAVTGSNGKSTVVSMLGAMGEADGRVTRIGGNLGEPALDLLHNEPAGLYVLELSSFQLESTESLDATVAAVLNVSPDHLDRYPDTDTDAYAQAKARVWQGSGTVVANRDDPVVAGLVPAGRDVCWFGTTPPRDTNEYGLDAGWLCRGEQRLLSRDDLHVQGLHNAANALAALALGEALGLSRAAMLAALRDFEGLPHRMQVVAEAGGVTWIDDSKATNIGATLAAVNGLDRPLVLLLGGDGKGQDFRTLTLPGHVRAAVLLGRDAEAIEAVLEGSVKCRRATGMDEAVQRAAELARPGDAVLLSPACASTDMFADFAERGRAFAAAAGKVGA